MEGLATSLFLAHPSHHHIRAKSVNAAAVQHKANKKSKPSIESDDASKAQKPHRSHSWLVPHRKKDSGSAAARLTKKPRRTSSTSAPPVPIRHGLLSPPSSRGSYESDVASNSSRALSNSTEATTVELSDPPKRPKRPHRGLFEWPVVNYADAEAEDDEAITSHEVMSADVHQLMREADLAYEAVGVALSQTKTASSYASVFSEASAPPPIVPGRPSHRANSHALRKGEDALSYARKGSSASAESESRRQARSSRWTLTENMADMFKAQRRPMTPTRIEAIWNGQDNGNNARASSKRKGKEKQNKATPDSPKSAEPCMSAATETLRLEPFHYPDTLPPSAGMRMRATPFEIVIPPPPSSVLFSQEIIHHNLPPQRSPSKLEDRKDRDPDPDQDADLENDDGDSEISVPLTPPPKNPARFAARSPPMSPLPPIPEGIRATTPDVTVNSKPSVHRRSRSLNQAAEVKGECVYFRSTPFTLTNPTFRHGPIIFQKSDLDRVSVVAEEPVEDDVDWAAFQTAILGGAGSDLHEFFPEMTGETEDNEGNIADDVTEWFEGFGFESHGELVDSDRSSQRDSTGSLTSSASSPPPVNTCSDGELKVPADSRQHQNVFDTIKLLRNRCNSIWTIDSGDASCGEAGIDETAAATAETKHNMEHGLQGFLKWEADHTYGGAPHDEL